MSFDVFLQSFSSEEAASGDGAAVMRILEPLLENVDGDYAQIAVPGGQAEVYGLEDPHTGLMVNRITGSAAWDVLVQIAKGGRFFIMPTGCSIGVPEGLDLHDLPAELRDEAMTVTTGADLRQLISTLVITQHRCGAPFFFSPSGA